MDADGKIKILFISANPLDGSSSPLRVDQEFRDIQEQIRMSKHREKFQLEIRPAARPRDISQAILEVEPNIVHFSGHGYDTGELCFESMDGSAQPVDPEALADLFEIAAEHVHAVVLNACYSVDQAEAIAQHIPYVVGMNDAIGDKAAITFSVGFYKALGAGKSVADAFKVGRVELKLEGIPESDTLVLHHQRPLAEPVRWSLSVEGTVD
ncbi:MAG: CHAT domain-containing protein, partial [Cyanobacteria bacterium P01_E01_bin.43]